MRRVGTTVRGIRTPIIKENDDLATIVVDSLMAASEEENFAFRDRDVIGITEAVVGISEGNYVTVDDVAVDIQKKFPDGHIGLLFPTPVSRNRFAPYLKGIARGAKKITMQLSFPDDELGNKLFPEDLLYEHGISHHDVLSEADYDKFFKGTKHIFTGIDYLEYFRELIEAEDCEIDFIFANDAREILKHARDVLVSNVHRRERNKKILEDAGASTVYTLDEIMNASINGSGFNPKYGLLGSNRATDERIKLFPKGGQAIVEKIQILLRKKTGKKIEVMVYGDGAFKDPVGGIWELADPVVSPAYTSGLEGTPSELKLKYVSDSKFADLRGKKLEKAIKDEIRAKGTDLVGENISLGTTPRRFTDLIGSLCDLTSGSGDKGTPVVYISGYFDSLADD
ncbi:coenzyme F420-0:L-glutamate ligase [Candidatus Saccharibacteria bacterium]|nr:coenzyme F420-0:L-glutamate ligase [Candidatus Saccharibacteria bacterium]